MIECAGTGQPGCPSRYICYPNEIKETNISLSQHDLEQLENVCLCNKIMLFHGESCDKNSNLAYLTSSITVAHGFYALVIIAYNMIRCMRRRRSAKDLLAASVLCFLVGLTAFPMYAINLFRLLDTGFDDRSWESIWVPKMTSLMIQFASLNVTSVARIFLQKLQAVGVIRGYTLVLVKTATYFCQAISTVGCLLIFTSQSTAHILVYAVISIIGAACFMAVAAFRTQRYLSFSSARYAGRAQSTSNLAQHQLVVFVKAFCFWLGNCSLCAISTSLVLFHPISNSSRELLNLLNLGMFLSLNKLGLIECDYFLLPEKRLLIEDLILFMFEMLGHLIILISERGPVGKRLLVDVPCFPAESSFSKPKPALNGSSSSISSRSGILVGACSDNNNILLDDGVLSNPHSSVLSRKPACSVRSLTNKAMFSIEEEESSTSLSSADEDEEGKSSVNV